LTCDRRRGVLSEQILDRAGSIRDGLRLLEEDQKRRQAVIDGLRGEIEKGRRSGKPKPAAEVLDRLERKYTKLTKDRAK
jgi:Arc/MetJ-type ribon-helix-helix transcriptional regulator